MESKIIVDSCLDYNTSYLENKFPITRIPFKFNISNEEITDCTISTDKILLKMKASKEKITTACPSPQDYLNTIDKDKINYIITISSKLSGSYNSAVAAQKMADQEDLGKIIVFDSKSAAAAQDLITIKLIDKILQEKKSDEIHTEIQEYINKLDTTFILNSLDNLAKNGRISNVSAMLGKLLHITPIMGADENGNIELKEKVRGKENAFKHMKQIIEVNAKNKLSNILAITHVNAREKAERLKADIALKCIFKKILIFDAGGLSTIYGDDGGIIVAY